MGWLEDGQRLFVCNPHRWFMWPPYDVMCTISKPQTPVHIQCCVYLYGFRAYFLLRLLCAALLNSHFVCMQIGERFVRVCGTHVEPSSGVIYSLTRSRHYACRGSRPLVVGDSLSVLAVLACIFAEHNPDPNTDTLCGRRLRVRSILLSSFMLVPQ